MPLDKPLENITEEDLLNLIANQEAEQQIIDYKKGLFLNAEPPRNEFRADVSSFANASGGHLVIGMDEKDGFPTDLCGMDIPDPDAFKRQVDDVLQTKITPRIPNVGVCVRPLSNGKAAAIIRVPKSFAKPHQITVNKDDFQFWARNSAGKYRLDVGELRSIILQSDTLSERIRTFRLDRLGNIIAGDTPVRLREGARAILHLVPLEAFSPGIQYDVAVLQKCPPELTAPLVSYRNYYSYRRFNLDGFLAVWAAARDGEPDRAYLQVFRNGIMEAVDAYYINNKEAFGSAPNPRSIWAQYNEVAYLDGLERGTEMLKVLGVPPPVAVFATLAGVRGHQIYVERYYGDHYPFARDVMLLPDVLIEDYDTPADQLLRPIFDAIWNEGGFPHCLNYDKPGKHIRL